MSLLKYDLIEEPTQQSLKNRGYRILSKINQGSYAKVCLAEFISPSGNSTNTRLAVKILETKHKPSAYVKKFLAREINILSQIDHPNIIHIHSILQIGLKYYVFMRLAEIGDLLDFMLENGRVNENQARVWSHQIAVALQYLHQLNIAHRDIKCENILVTINYNVKLSDFGFARYTVDLKKKPVLSETYCGTLLYASPEILHGKPYNPKISDLWSFGVVIYAMLNKALPFEDNNAKTLYQHQISRNFKYRLTVVDLLSSESKKLIGNLLEPDPVKRCTIENVINSDWIAMDKRLQKLSPMELAALSTANARHPPGNIKLTEFNIEKSKFDDNAEQICNIDEILPYTESTKQLSADSRIPPLPNKLQIETLTFNTDQQITQ